MKKIKFQCTRCKKEKSIDDFYLKIKRKTIIVGSWCKLCVNTVSKETIKRNHEKWKVYGKKYGKEHLEEKKIWRDNNKEKIKGYEINRILNAMRKEELKKT